MGEIIDFNKKRLEKITKITAEEILKKYWNKRDIPIDILDIISKLKEFKIELQVIDTSFEKGYEKFFACISHEKNKYIIYYKKEMKPDSLRMIATYALSYILQGIIEKSADKIVYIDERMLREDNPNREHEKIALKFAQELLMPLAAIIKLIEVLNNQQAEPNVGNIARYMEIANIYVVSNRLVELKYLK